jgi:hypothetical protein
VAGLPGVQELLNFMLVRDAALRPTLRDVLAKLDALLAAHDADLPPHQHRRDAGPAEPWAPPPPAPEAGAAPPEAPLPLRALLPVLPALLLAGPAAAVQPAELRERGVRSVVLLLAPAPPGRKGGAAGPAPSADSSPASTSTVTPGASPAVARRPAARQLATAGARSPLPVAKQLSFNLSQASLAGPGGGAAPRARAPGHAALLHILASDQLSACVDACTAAGAECVAAFGAGAADAAGAARWLDATLPALAAAAAAGPGPALLAAEPGCEGDLALLTVAFLVRHQGLSPYRAMVEAAHWGVDLLLQPAHMEVMASWAQGGPPP